ncbi:MAG: energy-coupled thiamine transporter ThiT [Candidatus Bathyarchaeota archaeon]|nr:MAG: energy-coupled thiamine transporter ThiT [Candidatus Bathyarchaeota archaeon]
MSESATTFPTKVIAEIAAFVAVSTALSYVKVFSLPQGGSVTAGSMVPVIWLSLRRGAKIGLFACMLYGLVQLVIEAFIFHPAQVLLDYPIAFGALGLAGFFQKRPSLRRNGLAVDVDRLVSVLLCIATFALFSYELAELRLSEALFFAWLFAFSFVFLLWLEDRRRTNEKKDASKLVTPALFGAAIGIFGRFLAHFISGVVFFGSYAPEGLSPIIYSALYNGAYIVPELLVSAYLIYLLAKSGLIGIYK